MEEAKIKICQVSIPIWKPLENFYKQVRKADRDVYILRELYKMFTKEQKEEIEQRQTVIKFNYYNRILDDDTTAIYHATVFYDNHVYFVDLQDMVFNFNPGAEG